MKKQPSRANLTPQKTLVAAVGLAVFAAFFVQTSSAEDDITFYRQGDRDLGRKKFAHYQCTRCHAVFLDSDLPQPIPQFQAPTLGAPKVALDVEKVVKTILGTEHEKIVQEGPYRESKSEIGLESYDAELAEQDVIDIVTYLRSTG